MPRDALWTAEMDEALKSFYLSGELSASKTAERIGTVSRSAVIARAHRVAGHTFPSDMARKNHHRRRRRPPKRRVAA